MDRVRLVVLVSPLLIENIFAEIAPVDPKCFDPHSHKVRCCTAHRTFRGKCYPCVGAFGKECNKPCKPGYYGLKCQEKCHCERCNATTGECFYKAKASVCVGNTGYNCTIPCPKGYYGRGCKEECICENCDSITGVCPQQKTSRISFVSIAIFLAAGILFVAALVVCLFVMRSSRKISSNSDNNYMPESSTPGD
ncbi:multiple epidermal growth factor-like domains protein 10 [Saccostrea cucullata]|uniref:multiple epidermal growth factor-like domains protein 10 n=1 Tax=Saccostrea cuccullata TaxID=36930 RepID=UPI002ED2BCB9